VFIAIGNNKLIEEKMNYGNWMDRNLSRTQNKEIS
jgi:hypothetical protein